MATRKPDPVDIDVWQRIKIQRLAAGLSQTELGDFIGVTFQQVQKYEKGANRVGAGRLTQIAGSLKIPVNTFFEDTTIAKRPPSRAACRRCRSSRTRMRSACCRPIRHSPTESCVGRLSNWSNGLR